MSREEETGGDRKGTVNLQFCLVYLFYTTGSEQVREGETHSGCRTTYLETTYTLNLFKVSRLEEQRDPVSLHLLFLNRYQG